MEYHRINLLWLLRNRIRYHFWLGWFSFLFAKLFSRITGIPTIVSELSIVLIRDNKTVDYGVVGYRIVTTVGISFLINDWIDDTNNITEMQYHASGTGNIASDDVTDTDLELEATTITDRVGSTKSQPLTNAIRLVGTQTFTGSATIVEHGIFSSITEGAGVLWDRTVFTGIDVIANDQIQFTYQCTLLPVV